MKAELASMSSPVRKIEQQLTVQLNCKGKKNIVLSMHHLLETKFGSTSEISHYLQWFVV